MSQDSNESSSAGLVHIKEKERERERQRETSQTPARVCFKDGSIFKFCKFKQ